MLVWQIFKLTDEQQAILVSQLPPTGVTDALLAQLEKALSQRTGLNISVSSISPHVQDGQVVDNSLVTLHASRNHYFQLQNGHTCLYNGSNNWRTND
jgi:hypothetical protein